MKINISQLFQFTCGCVHIQIIATQSSPCKDKGHSFPLAAAKLLVLYTLRVILCQLLYYHFPLGHAVHEKRATGKVTTDHMEILNVGAQQVLKEFSDGGKTFKCLAGLEKKKSKNKNNCVR